MASFNGATTLPKVLDAYCALLAPPGGWRLLVIDNGSTDAGPEILAAYAERLPISVLREPCRGKNAALNAGLRQVLNDAGVDLLVFSDDDAMPEPDWLLRLAECAARQP